MTKLVDLAYIAGLLDGEGSIQIAIAGNRTTYYPRISISNQHQPTIRWLKDMFGGHISSDSRSRGFRKNRATLTWSLTGHPALKIVELLRPFLRIKRTQAWFLLEFGAQRQHWYNRGSRYVSRRLRVHGKRITLGTVDGRRLGKTDESRAIDRGFYLGMREARKLDYSLSEALGEALT